MTKFERTETRTPVFDDFQRSGLLMCGKSNRLNGGERQYEEPEHIETNTRAPKNEKKKTNEQSWGAK